MSGPKLWPKLGKHPLNQPQKRKQAGRPKKLRKGHRQSHLQALRWEGLTWRWRVNVVEGLDITKEAVREHCQQQSQLTTQIESQEDTHTRSAKGKRKAHSTKTSKSQTKKSNNRASKSWTSCGFSCIVTFLGLGLWFFVNWTGNMCFQCYYFVDVTGISDEIVECDDTVDVEFLALCFCWLSLVKLYS